MITKFIVNQTNLIDLIYKELNKTNILTSLMGSCAWALGMIARQN